MIQAWAYEQGEDSKKQFNQQDTMVNWTLSKRFLADAAAVEEGTGAEAAMPTAATTSTSTMSAGAAAAVLAGDSGACQHATESPAGDMVYQRYCHVYKEGELEDLCSTIPGKKE